MNQLDKTKKSIDLMFAAAVLINTAAAQFKTDNDIYKHKTKRLVNELYNESIRILNVKEATRNDIGSEQIAKEYSEKNNVEVDTEIALERFDDENELLVKLVSLYLKTVDYGRIVDIKIIIDQLLENKRVYTQVELLDKLKTAINDNCNFKINEEILKKYL